MDPADPKPALPTLEEYRCTRRQVMLAVSGGLAAIAVGATAFLARERVQRHFSPPRIAGEMAAPPIAPKGGSPGSGNGCEPK